MAKSKNDLKTFVTTYTEIVNGGGSYDDVATKLGMKPNSVKQRVTTVRKMLKEKFNKTLPTPASAVRGNTDAQLNELIADLPDAASSPSTEG